MMHLLRRTLVLQQFYSTIVAVACPERVEGFGNSMDQICGRQQVLRSTATYYMDIHLSNGSHGSSI